MKFKGTEIEAVLIEDFSAEVGYDVLHPKKKLHIWGEDYLLKCKKGNTAPKYYIIGVKPQKKGGVILDGTGAAIALFRAFVKWSPLPYEVLECKLIGGEGGDLE